MTSLDDRIPDIKTRIDLSALVERYGGAPVGSVTGGVQKYHCPHPSHDDGNPSFTVDLNRQTWHCWSRCDAHGDAISFLTWIGAAASTSESIDTLASEAGLARAPEPRTAPSSRSGVHSSPAQEDIYTDEHGAPLRKVTRWEPSFNGLGNKSIVQYSPDGNGGWRSGGVAGVRNVLLGLPDLRSVVAEGKRWVFIVEGERCARWAKERLGVVATTCAEGAGKFTDEMAECLRGARGVAIVGDNDSKGQQHAADVAAKVYGRAKQVRVIELPDLPEKGDIVEWIEAGGTRDALREILDATPDWTPPDPESGRELPATEVIERTWPEVIPLRGTDRLPDFPIEILPVRVRRMIEAVALKHAAPLDFVTSVALGAIASIACRGVSIEPEPGWVVPANLYLLAALPVAQGKSPVYHALTDELVAIEREWQEEARPAIVAAETDKAIAIEAAGAAKRDAVKGGKDFDVMAARERARELALEADAMTVPPLPRVLSNEPTPEAVARICGGNGGSLAILADEGAEVFQLTSRYTQGSANIGIYLQGYEGRSYTPDRASKDLVPISRLTLTMVLCVQPSVLLDLGADRANRERGLLARFLICHPEAHIGERPTMRPRIPEQVQSEWNGYLRELAAAVRDRPEPLVLSPSGEASRIWQSMLDSIEPRLHPANGDLRNCQDWGGKAQHHVARLAAVLQLAATGTSSAEVSAQTMQNAVTVFDHYAEHAKVGFHVMQERPEQRVAQKVWRWITAREDYRADFSQREAFQGTKGGVVASSADLVPALRVLAEHGHIEELEAPGREPGKAGRTPSPRYAVNPHAVAPVTPTTPPTPNSGGIGGTYRGVPSATAAPDAAAVELPEPPDRAKGIDQETWDRWSAESMAWDDDDPRLERMRPILSAAIGRHGNADRESFTWDELVALSEIFDGAA